MDSFLEYLSYKYHNESYYPTSSHFQDIIIISCNFNLLFHLFSPRYNTDEIPEAMDDGFGAVFPRFSSSPKPLLVFFSTLLALIYAYAVICKTSRHLIKFLIQLHMPTKSTAWLIVETKEIALSFRYMSFALLRPNSPSSKTPFPSDFLFAVFFRTVFLLYVFI